MHVFPCDGLDAWYELGYRPEGLLVRVDAGLFEDFRRRTTTDLPVHKVVQNGLNLPEFIPPTESAWGYGGAFQQIHEDNRWVTYHAPWPSENVTRCRDESSRFIATLWWLGIWLPIVEKPKDWIGPFGHKQLMQIQNIAVGSDYCSFAVNFPPIMAETLGQANADQIRSISQTMADVHERLLGRKAAFGLAEFDCSLDISGRLRMNLGHRTALDPDWSNSGMRHEGYALIPHNVDTQLQFLTLLAGVARVHDVVLELMTSRN